MTSAAGKIVFKDANNKPSTTPSTKRVPRPGGASRPPGTIKPVYGAQHPPLHQPPNPDVLKTIGDTTPIRKPQSTQHKNVSNSSANSSSSSARPGGVVVNTGGVNTAGVGGGSVGTTEMISAGRNHGDSFDDFASRTRDAWDDGDDDLLTIATSNLNIQDQQQQSQRPLSSIVVRKTDRESVLLLQKQQQQKTTSQTRKSITSASSSSTRRRTEGAATANDAGVSSTASSTTASSTSTPPSKGPAPGMALRLGAPVEQNSNVRKSTKGILAAMNAQGRSVGRLTKFNDLLSSANPNLDELRELSWNGIPKEVRPVAWQLLSGYLPPNVERREATLERKRSEYYGFVEQYFPQRNSAMHQDTYRQIHIDIPRMNPLIPLFQKPVVQEIFERILFIWAVRHPASGYVQGMNDLVTPFFVVFLSQFLDVDITSSNSVQSRDLDMSGVSEDSLKSVEADSFWCFSKLLDGIQDNYTFAQPGIQLKVLKLKDLTKRIDADLHHHMEQESVEYLQFAFRWMNNLLMREMPLHCTVRLWDTYWSEPDGFAVFHLYVCASFLNTWAKELKQHKDFQGIMIFLQNPPTCGWGDAEISLMLAEAFRLKFLFAEAPNHLRESTEPPPVLLPHS